MIAEKIDYRTAEGINYSSLSKLVDGPDAFKNPEPVEGEAIDNGSAVDVILTEGEDAFLKQFYVMTVPKPSSDMMLAYVETMLNSNGNHELALQASGYKSDPNRAPKSNPDGPTKWEKEGKPYYDAIIKAKGKIVLSFEQYEKIIATINQLKNNTYTKKFFTEDLPENVEVIRQFEYYWDLSYVDNEKGLTKYRKAKMKADLIFIDHNTKKIYPKDLKTTGKPTKAFLSSYRTFRYYLQEGIYKEGIIDWAKHDYPGYDVEDFEFIVAQMGAYSQPLIFTVDESQHAKNFYGGESATGYPIKGVAQLLCDLDYYESVNKWEYERDVVDNNGRINVELFK